MSIGLIAGTMVILLLVFFLVLFLVEYQNRRKQFLREKLNFQQELLQSQLEIQEQTLKNISQEIHDNIGQSLSLAKLNLNTIDIFKTEVATQKILNTKELVSKAIFDLRDLSKSLNTDSRLASGLVKAIEQELSMIEKAGVFTTQFTVTGAPFVLDKKRELILFRILQEAINNIIKHSQADKITVNVKFFQNNVILDVEDNGIGFSAPSPTEGSGLQNMRSRVELIGGNIDIITRESGTIIHLTIPRTT